MLDYKIVIDPESGDEIIETALLGKSILTTSLLNKGTAFTQTERRNLHLLGKLPAGIESLSDQVRRTKQQYLQYTTPMQKNIYLNNLHDKNEVLFYKLVSENLAEMMPMIYTPMVGAAVKKFSHEFRQPRGIYLSYPDAEFMEEILDNRTHPQIDLIVVTDGERVLGIGDQGVGAMDIPIAKIKLYILCGGINPFHCLPIMLDVGTNNQYLLNDPLYLGWRHERISGEQYDAFIDKFVQLVKKKFPKAFLHWEDFGRDNARRILEQYQDELCTFNDDMQGTAVVTLSAVLSAVKRMKQKLTEQRFVIYGAGTAGVGIADQLLDALQREGLSYDDALRRFWLIDRNGLIVTGMDMLSFQARYARPIEDPKGANLETVIQQFHPTVLIGCSSQAGAFNEKVLKTMAQYIQHPVILPLSNPNECAEAQPDDILAWTDGRAYIATGSPFDPVVYNGYTINIPQCNNALAFPGIGLGVIAARASKLSDNMLWAACQALSDFYPHKENIECPILPTLGEAPDVTKKIAVAVAKQACRDGVATVIDDIEQCEEIIQNMIWAPYYRPIRPFSE